MITTFDDNKHCNNYYKQALDSPTMIAHGEPPFTVSRETNRMHYVYSVARNNRPIAVGIAPGNLPRLATAGDTINVHHAFNTDAEAVAYRAQLETHWQLNKPATSVLCEQTGSVYGSAYAAAKAVNASASAMSNHLAGKTGFRTVKGYTFRRVSDAPTC